MFVQNVILDLVFAAANVHLCPKIPHKFQTVKPCLNMDVLIATKDMI